MTLSKLYRAAIRRRNLRYDRGVGVERLDRPVISVGNITVGGTGKTPMVSWIVEVLLDAGRTPAIAMRGYGAKKGAISDENAEYVDRFPDIPVIAQPDRVDGLRAFFASGRGVAVDCIVLDDGFQHRQLHRDLDLVLIDATQNTFSDRVLPAGRLREPVAALSRADAVIVTRSPQLDTALEFEVRKAHGKKAVAWSSHCWKSLALRGPVDETVPPNWLRGKKAVAMFGVGNPETVEAMVHEHGAIIRRRFPVRDHEPYQARQLDAVREACAHPQIDALIVTQKDWVKLRDLADWSSWPCPVAVPELELAFSAGEDALRSRILRTVRVEDHAQPSPPRARDHAKEVEPSAASE